MHFISILATEHSVVCQSCVASVLSVSCKTTEEQNALCAARAPQILTALLASPHLQVQLPTLNCITNMCYENSAVAREIANLR